MALSYCFYELHVPTYKPIIPLSTGLKIRFWRQSAGSIPAPGTNKNKALEYLQES